MEIKKANDILVATLNNPNSSPYDFMTESVSPENTSLFTKDQYKQTDYVKKQFTDENGNFDDKAFDAAYNKASAYYKAISDEEFLSNLATLEYSPFDVTRPIGAKTYSPEVVFGLDWNPFKEVYSRVGINSISPSEFSPRELAQQNKVYDPETDTWSEVSANDMGLFQKFFGDTLVYAQWEEDGMHMDPRSGHSVEHKKGEWKYDDNGNLFLERLGNREIYGKQVLNPMDVLTDDGSLANKYIDFLDSDSREKSIAKSTASLVFSIAPFFIPGVGQVYGGLKAVMGLSAIMPTFYKAMEGILLGDSHTSQWATSAENYMAKFNQRSVSDAGSESFFNYEQISQMVGDIFTQLYEQRAAASLSMLIKRPSLSHLDDKSVKILKKVNEEIGTDLLRNKITLDQAMELRDAALKKIPEVQRVIDARSKLAKSLSLGYMALTQSADVYGEAIEGGYDRRTAGFAAITSAAGQYGIMANNRMGDWFLDHTVGYTGQASKAQMIKALKPYLGEIQKTFDTYKANPVKAKINLVDIYRKVQNKLEDFFINPAEVGNAMVRNAFIEGMEEVSEQAVMDATKGMIDIMAYLGLTKKEGSFGGFSNVFSSEGLQNYLANFVGGTIGGGLFEFQRLKIEPLINGTSIDTKTKADIYSLVADGNLDQMVKYIKDNKHRFGNGYISTIKEDGSFDPADPSTLSQADLVSEKAIEMLKYIDGIINSQDLKHTDEEVVSKALRDSMILKDLREFRGESLIGIEGLILSDFKENVNKIVELTTQINGLTGEKEADAEAIKRLTEERQLYKDDVEKILSGELAEQYFTEALLYLSIGKDLGILDKNTYVKNTYGKNYNDLAEEGAGLTKKRVDKEYDDYVKSSDLRKYIKVLSKAYQELEQNSNQSIVDYTENGYADERIKTFKTFINQALSERLFARNENIDRKGQLNNFIILAKQIEEKTGIRVLPWDTIYNDFAQSVMESPGFSVNQGEEELQLGEETKTKKEFAAEILQQVINMMPPDQVDYALLSQHFADAVNDFNQKIYAQNPEVTKPLIDEKTQLIAEGQQLTVQLNTKIEGEPQEDYNKRITSLQIRLSEIESRLKEINEILGSMGIDASLVQFAESDSFKQNYETLRQEALAKHGIDDSTLEALQRFSGKPLEKVNDSDNIPDVLASLTALAEVFGTNVDGVLNEYKNLIDLVEAADINPEDKQSILLQGAYKGDIGDLEDPLNNFLDSYRGEVEKINSLVEQHNSKIGAFNAYNKEIKNIRESLINNAPEIFSIHNLLIPALLAELQGGNLDGELLIMAEQIISQYFVDMTRIVKDFTISEDNVKFLTSLSDEELRSLALQVDQSASLDKFMLASANNIQIGFIKDIVAAVGALDITEPETLVNLLGEDLAIEAEEALGLDNARRIDVIEWAKANDEVSNDLVDKLDKTDDLFESQRKALSQISAFLHHIINNRKNIIPVQKLIDVTADKTKFKINSIYDFLRNKFDVYLDRKSKMVISKIWDLLEQEESKLKLGPSVEAYFYSGATAEDIRQAINTLTLLKTVIKGLTTTEVSYGDPYGMIASRQAFAKRNELEAEVLKLKSIPSDMATLMQRDIDRIISKLEFYIDVAKHNSGLISKEQKLIEEKFNNLLLKQFQDLVKNNITINEKVFIPDIEDITSSEEPTERKLFLIGERIHKNVANWTAEEKEQLGDEIAKSFKFQNRLDSIYSKDGTDEVTKDIRNISNNDMVLYLLSTIAVNPRDFNSLMSKALEKFDKAPFFTQRLGIQIMYASLVNPKLFSNVLKKISPISTTPGETWTHDTSLITYVLGSAGTGKTTVMYKMLLLLLQETNDTINVWFSAPEQSQANKLEKDVLVGIESGIGKETLSKQKLFERLGLKDIIEKINKDSKKFINPKDQGEFLTYDEATSYLKLGDLGEITFPKDIPHIIFIDEISHFTAIEQELLNYVSEQTGVKIYGAGDVYQRGVDFNGINYNVGRVSGVFAPNLFLTIRAQNNQKRGNNQLLFSLSRVINKNWEAPSKSTKATFETILKEGITLHYYKTEDTLNGDLIANAFTPDLVKVIANNIKQNPNKVLGILGNEETSETLKATLESLGISEKNYIIVDPKKVQGQEFDYFVFNLSEVKKEKSIFDAIKALYTYTSRAKNGSIIINDASLDYEGHTLALQNSEDNLTDEVTPLRADVIEQLIKDEKTRLDALLGGALNIENPFIFSKSTASIPPIIPEISTDETTDNTMMEMNGDELEMRFSFKKSGKPGETPENTTRAMVHTFYHDVNAQVKQTKSNVNLTKNIDMNAQLSYLFPDGETTVDITPEQYNKELDFLVREKFSVLQTEKVSLGFLKKVFKNPTLVSKDVDQTFVITASKYQEKFNSPVGLLYDNKTKHLKNGSKYITLSVKLSYEGQEYFLHLGTFPDTKTLEGFANTYKNTKLAGLYQNLQGMLEIPEGQTHTSIEIGKADVKERMLQFTSTRLYKKEPETKAEREVIENIKNLNTFERIVELPGINFYGWNNSKVDKPFVMFFPGKLEDFKRLYKSTTFGDQLSDEQLENLYKKKRNKPYIAVSFIDSPSSIKFLPLISKKRSWKEVTDIVVKGNLLNKLAKLSSDMKKAKDGSADHSKAKAEMEKITAITDSLFSGNDILDLLISTAQNRPDLLKSFQETGKQAFAEAFGGQSASAIEARAELLGTFSGSVEANVWGLVTKSGADAIMDTIIKGVEQKKDTATLKKEVISLIKTKEYKHWFNKFWRLIAFQQKYGVSEEEKRFKHIFTKDMFERMNKNLTDIIDYWKSIKPEIYYNIPAYWDPAQQAIYANPNATSSDLFGMTYSSLDVEGPRMLFDIDGLDGKRVDTTEEKRKVIENWNLDAPTLRKIATIAGITTLQPNSKKATIITALSTKGTSIKDLETYKAQALEDVEKIRLVKAINKYNFTEITADSDMSIADMTILLEKLEIIKQIKNIDNAFDPANNIEHTKETLLEMLETARDKDKTPDIEKELQAEKALWTAEQGSVDYSAHMSEFIDNVINDLNSSEYTSEEKVKFSQALLPILQQNKNMSGLSMKKFLLNPKTFAVQQTTWTDDEIDHFDKIIYDGTKHCK